MKPTDLHGSEALTFLCRVEANRDQQEIAAQQEEQEVLKKEAETFLERADLEMKIFSLKIREQQGEMMVLAIQERARERNEAWDR